MGLLIAIYSRRLWMSLSDGATKGLSYLKYFALTVQVNR